MRSCITADAASVLFGLASGISLCMLPANGTRDAPIATRRLRSAQAQDAVSNAAPGATELDHSHGITEAGDQAEASESQQQPGRSAYDEALEQVWACTALLVVLLLQPLCYTASQPSNAFGLLIYDALAGLKGRSAWCGRGV